MPALTQPRMSLNRNVAPGLCRIRLALAEAEKVDYSLNCSQAHRVRFGTRPPS